jgi:hypothetical protein
MFETQASLKEIGERVGYVAAYVVFTTLVYWFLLLLNRAHWSYWLVACFTLLLTAVGFAIRRFLR